MFSSHPSLPPAIVSQNFSPNFLITLSSSNLSLYPVCNLSTMWRKYAQKAILGSCNTSLRRCSFIGSSNDLLVSDKLKFRPFELSNCKNLSFPEMGFCRKDASLLKKDVCERPVSSNQGNLNGLRPKGYASIAGVELNSSVYYENETSVVDEVQELVEEMRREETRAKRQVLRERKPKFVAGMSYRKYQALRDRQIKLETESWRQAANEYREMLADMCKHSLAPNLPYVKSLFLGWFEPLRDAIMEDQELIREGKSKAAYGPFFDLLPADMMAIITMHKMMGMIMTGSGHGNAKVVHAACAIGEAIEQEIRIHKFLEKTKKKKKKKKGDPIENVDEGSPIDEHVKQQLRKNVDNLIKRQQRRRALQIVSSNDEIQSWSTETRAKVGSRLIELLLKTAFIQPSASQSAEDYPNIRPAFLHALKNVGPDDKKTNRRYGVIECDPEVIKGLENTPRHMVIPYLPMLVPPEKWTGYSKGAYLVLRSFVMRTHGSKPQREAIKSASMQQMGMVYEALDTLGNTKWRINTKVLSIVDRIWTTGGGLADLVDRNDLPYPEKPETEDESELKKWKWKVRSVRKENRERHSLRCDMELKLAVARKLKDEEGFFYPHNIDFRGRAYPMHPYLNHLGSDVCRGILEFAEGRPLGKSGFHWLKIHLANLYAGGVDKLSLEGRVSFIDNHLDDIIDSADKPLDGRRWWLKAEDPFQCLAVCIDLAEALRSPCPEAFVSHIPVHQDGSCNGLQHYAALGRDKLGAAAVNLVAGEKPADVYAGIAERVLAIMKRDAELDPEEFPEAVHARQLVNQVNRKLVKQTVMTSVYGVTYIGARDQIKKRLKERSIFDDDKELFGAACYAAKTTLTALGEMFQGARGIMTWLGDCAKLIAVENESVKWTTPMGLPVVQPYYQKGKRLIKTSLQQLTLEKESDKIMIRRQRTAFPPNFVHSLDGSHMMMTAVACKNAGLNFAGVHDSYWTHASDVDQMNWILRQKFVELYEQPILENLLSSFQQSFPAVEFPPLPDRGDFDLNEVLKSPYFFN